MEPRELDALVAEKVMGWTPVPINHWLPAGKGRGDIPSCWLSTHPIHGEQTLPMSMWHPSSHMEEAWQVKTQMRELGWSCHTHSGSADQPYVSVSFRKPTEPIQWAEELDANKEAKALCIAALKALGIPIEGGE